MCGIGNIKLASQRATVSQLDTVTPTFSIFFRAPSFTTAMVFALVFVTVPVSEQGELMADV